MNWKAIVRKTLNRMQERCDNFASRAGEYVSYAENAYNNDPTPQNLEKLENAHRFARASAEYQARRNAKKYGDDY